MRLQTTKCREGQKNWYAQLDTPILKILCELHDKPQLVISTANRAFEKRVIFSERAVMDSYLAILPELS